MLGLGDEFPISRDPPEGGTICPNGQYEAVWRGFQFLGIPPKGEHCLSPADADLLVTFPISRDPPEGGTLPLSPPGGNHPVCFQFLGIPPKGEQEKIRVTFTANFFVCFQFLGIPPKGELAEALAALDQPRLVSNF